MEKRRIQDIFSGTCQLEVPYFQRSYVWEEENWKRFLEDFKEICENQKDYFMGTYIMKQKPTPSGSRVGDVRAVIDGQQRFTTIVLFFLVLAIRNHQYDRDFKNIFFGRNTGVLLKHNHTDRPIFELLVRNSTLTNDDRRRYKTNKVFQVYEYFMKNLNPEDYDVDILLRHVYFSPIDLDQSDDEQQIFDTINSLGVRLTTAELLKNALFSNMEVELFKNTWEDCFEKNQSEKDFWDTIVGSREKHSNLDTFLYAYLSINVSSDIRYKSLFSSYTEYISQTIDAGTSKEEFITDLIEYAKIYRDKINPEIQSTVLRDSKNSIDRLNVVFFGLDTTTLLPYCLYVLKNASEDEANKIFGYLETYVVRRMLCHSSTKNYSKKFKTMINQRIVTFEELKRNILEGNETEDRMPTDADLENSVSYDHTNAQVRGILYLLEAGLRTPGRESTSILALENYDLEHIMPRDWRRYWALPYGENTTERSDNRDTHVGYLGNKTLLSKGLNKSIKNRDFRTKKEGLRLNTGYNQFAQGLMTFDCSNYSEWDETTIERRQQELINLIEKVWPYDSVR